jgi:hypothetical protein
VRHDRYVPDEGQHERSAEEWDLLEEEAAEELFRWRIRNDDQPLPLTDEGRPDFRARVREEVARYDRLAKEREFYEQRAHEAHLREAGAGAPLDEKDE